MNINKSEVSKRFAKAQNSYVHEAVVQKKICAQLYEYMNIQNVPNTQNRIFEIGCGTGNLTNIITQKMKYQDYFINDLYETVHENFADNLSLEWKIGDIEQLEFPHNLDLIVSSSALQWMENLQAIFQKAHVALNVDGYFCFSTFGQMNLKEIKLLTGQGLNYLSINEIKQLLENIGFEVRFVTDAIEQLLFNEPQQVLKHLKATGVTGSSSNFRWTKQSLNQFIHDYQKYAVCENGTRQYSLTYHPIYCIARRKK